MKLELSDANFPTFKNAISLMKTVNEELTLNFDDEGIRVRGMDPSHVAMIDIRLKPGLFDRFDKTEDMITVNLAELYRFLDRVEKGEQVTIIYDKKEAKLAILTERSGTKRRFALPTLEPLDDEVPEPKILWKSEGRILTQSIDRAIKDSDLVAEHVKIMFTNDTMVFNAVGDVGSARNEWEKDSDELLQLKSEEDSAATFTLHYLKDMFGQLKNLTDVVTLHLANDMPLRIESDENENIEIDLFLAPCIGV